MPDIEKLIYQHKLNNLYLARIYLQDEISLIREYAENNNMQFIKLFLTTDETMASFSLEKLNVISTDIKKILGYLIEHFGVSEFRASKIIEQVLPFCHSAREPGLPYGFNVGGSEMETFNSYAYDGAVFLLDLLVAKGEIDKSQKQNYRKELQNLIKGNKADKSYEFCVSRFSHNFFTEIEKIVTGASSNDTFQSAVKLCFNYIKAQHNYEKIYEDKKKVALSEEKFLKLLESPISSQVLKQNSADASQAAIGYGRLFQAESSQDNVTDGKAVSSGNNLFTPQKRQKIG